MCGRIRLSMISNSFLISQGVNIHNYLDTDMLSMRDASRNTNCYTLVIGASERRTLLLARWGMLIPPQHENVLLHARIETVLDRPMFASYYNSTAHRCVLFVNGWYEGSKHYVSVKGATQPIALAGIWNVTPHGGRRFVLMTVETTRPELSKIHNRQPCVVSPADWLNHARIYNHRDLECTVKEYA